MCLKVVGFDEEKKEQCVKSLIIFSGEGRSGATRLCEETYSALIEVKDGVERWDSALIEITYSALIENNE